MPISTETIGAAIAHDRRFSPNPNKFVTVLWEQHREIIRLAAIGLRNADIAKQLGVTPLNVSRVLNSPIGRAELRRLSELRDQDAARISERIRSQVDKALALTEQILDGRVVDADGEVQVPSMTLRARVASDILDRDPLSQKHSTRTTNDGGGALSSADIAEIIAAAQSIGICATESP